MTALVVVFCGLLIGLAIFLLVRYLRDAASGRCCEGCRSCPYLDDCEAAEQTQDGPAEGSAAASKKR